MAPHYFHRIHIQLKTYQWEWLKEKLGDERLISETFRKLIDDLIQKDQLKPTDIICQESDLK